MNFHVLTLFPEMIRNAFETSITGRALKEGILKLNVVNIRDFSQDRNYRVDDYTYGGGAGMLMQAEPVYEAFKSLDVPENTRVIYVTPAGVTFNQTLAEELSKEENLVFLCGHYEGIDERVIDKIVSDRVSIGDYVLTGGEMPALIMMDAISRLVPGVLGNNESAFTESFSDDLLEYPQYSRPSVWNELEVPRILLSGDHKKIEEYRLEESLRVTLKYRPDLYKKWSEKHQEYFEAKEKKRKKAEEKERKRKLKENKLKGNMESDN